MDISLWGNFMLLSEMTALPKFIEDKFGKYIKMNADSRAKRSANITYTDQRSV